MWLAGGKALGVVKFNLWTCSGDGWYTVRVVDARKDSSGYGLGLRLRAIVRCIDRCILMQLAILAFHFWLFRLCSFVLHRFASFPVPGFEAEA